MNKASSLLNNYFIFLSLSAFLGDLFVLFSPPSFPSMSHGTIINKEELYSSLSYKDLTS
jgi:hypothetical protein